MGVELIIKLNRDVIIGDGSIKAIAAISNGKCGQC